MSQRAVARSSRPRYFRADTLLTDMEGAVGAEPALGAVVIAEDEDGAYARSVRFDVDECIDSPTSRPGKHAEEFVPGPAYSRKCMAARVAARQRAIDLVGVLDGFD